MMSALARVQAAAVQLAKTGGRAFQITLPPRQYFAVVAEISELGPLGKWHEHPQLDMDLRCYVGVRCSPFWLARIQIKQDDAKVFVDINYDNDLEKDLE
jgi:hypothetical protein